LKVSANVQIAMQYFEIFGGKANAPNALPGYAPDQQCSSNVIEAPEPKQTKCNSIAKARKWNDTYLRSGPFCEILNVADTFQKCKNNINRSSH